MKKITNIIVFDTEFVSSRKVKQPIQICFQAYKIAGEKLVKIDNSNLDIYIRLYEGTNLTTFVKKYTRITEETLINEGITLEMAKLQVMEYLLKFKLNETVLLGWEIINDISMFNKLFNHDEDFIDVEKLRWVDLSRSFMNLRGLKQSIKLEDACETYGIVDPNFHNAYNDVLNTVKLLECMIKEFDINKVLYGIDETQVKPKIKKEKSIV